MNRLYQGMVEMVVWMVNGLSNRVLSCKYAVFTLFGTKNRWLI